MITGFNTDVDYDGTVYHVQTEDKGLENPVVESLVYTGGEIVTSRSKSYQDLVSKSTWSEEAVLQRMEQQHQQLIREVRNGEFDPDGPKPFGYQLVSNRSLDEVVLDYLSSEIGLERIRIQVLEPPVLTEGAHPELRLTVIAEESERPVSGARVRVRLISSLERPRVLFEGNTGEDGLAEARFEIPELGGTPSAVVCQAEAGVANAEVKLLVRVPGA